MNGKNLVGVAWISSRVTHVERPIYMAKRNLLRALLMTVAVGLILSFIISYYSTKRIKRLSRATQKVASGNFNVQIQHKDSDEIDQLAEELDKMLKKNAEEKDAGVTGLRSLINPRYKAEEFLKELHKLIDGHKCKEHVPYILILLEEKVLSRKPTWKEMRDEFKDIGASSNSNYCKFMKYKLKPVKTGECFDEEEILSKRSIIEDILERYNTRFISDFPF